MPEKGSIRISVAGATDVGRIRDHNEDNLLVADLTADERLGSGDSLSRALGERGLLIAVADGMGGAASGELASEMAVDVVFSSAKEFEVSQGKTEIDSVASSLAECMTTANSEIFTKSQAESEHRGMGTTMTAAWALGSQIAFAQVGDSRAYLLRKGKLVQVTKDQSLISQLIEDGTLTEEEAERLGGRNIILQALGVEEGVTVETKTMEILDGDLLVLCSDGLSGMIKDEEIERALSEGGDLAPLCDRLIAGANDAGGRDNITVVLVRFEGEGLRAPMKPLEAEEGQTTAPAFAPPVMPEAKPSRTKPLLFGLGGLAVAVVVFLVLTTGGGDVTFAFPVPGATGTLTPVDGGGETIALAPAEGEMKLALDGLATGKYRLQAAHPDYEDLDTTIEYGGGNQEIKVDMTPRPGVVVITSKLANVTVAITWKPRKATDRPWTREIALDAAGPTRIEEVPAGTLEFEAVRRQFKPRRLTKELPANGRLEFTLPPLDPILGRLEITGHVPGTKIVILDDWGEEVYAGEVTEGGGLAAEIRVGEHTLTATHEKYETFEDDVKISEGETCTVRLHPVEKRGSLLVRGPVGGRVYVTHLEVEDWPESRSKIPESGEVRIERIPPGPCEVRLEQPNLPVERNSVTVVPAKELTVEFPR